jgi:CRP/FNR family transcriptional regulator
MPSSVKIECKDCTLRRLCSTRDLSPEEFEVVKWFKAGDTQLESGTEIVAAGSDSPHLWTLYSGLAYRYIVLPDGRRQILNFLFPTDFIGLQASLFDVAEHSVSALTDVHLCVFPRERLADLFSKVPNLAYDITWLTATEQAFVDLNLVAVGQFRADQRIAYLFSSFFERMRPLGLSDDKSCPFPLTQQHVADALGLSLPYTNSAVRRLVGDGLVDLRGGRLRILDWDSFRERAVIQPRQRTPLRFI